MAGPVGTGGSDVPDDRPVLVVGTATPFKPFEALDPATGEFTGFDIDVMREIGKRAGFTPRFEDRPFDELIPGVQQEELDAAISAISITSNRTQHVAFSRPYYEANQSVSFRQGEGARYASLEDMEGHGLRVAAHRGTIGADIARDRFGNDSIRTFDDYEHAMEALRAKKVDAVIMDLPAQLAYVKAHKGVEMGFDFSVGDHYGIAVAHSDEDLVARINVALQWMFRDGTMHKLRLKWSV